MSSIGKISNKLPEGTKKAVVDYSCFKNKESIEKFDNTNDYSKFDFNEFFKNNPELKITAINHITMCINKERAKYNAENFDENAQVSEKTKHLINSEDLYQIGKNRALTELEMGVDFTINDNHNKLMKEMAECHSSLTYQTKPLLTQVFTTLFYLSDSITTKAEKFPRKCNNGLKREIREALTEIKKMASRLAIRGTKDTTIYHINENILFLRMCIEEARINKYFSKEETTNNREAAYLGSLVTKISDLVITMKKCSKK